MLRAETHKRPAKEQPAWSPNVFVILGPLLLFYPLLLYTVHLRLWYTPPVVPVDGDLNLFSEARALAHVHALAEELPDRQISMPQLDEATKYVVKQGELLRQVAEKRGDVDVQVHLENVTGAIPMSFLGHHFTNAYRGLPVVTITITPRAARGRKGLLLAAHYDSAVASPGASDDVAMVAVALEAARAVLAGESLPDVPLVLMLNGGEECICQAAHGFATQSPHAKNLGAFINLEAMGGGGLPILFQHTGAWVAEAWARGARPVRGARVAQDIFDAGLIPGDTDYRMLSARHYGHLPGLDVAFIKGSVVYHTRLDDAKHLRPGVLQEMGEALMGGLRSIAATMAAAEAVDGMAGLLSRKEMRSRVCYLDLGGYAMITYRDDIAAYVHSTPLVLYLLLPLSAVLQGHTTSGVMLRSLSGARRAMTSILLAMLLPVVLGAARAKLTGFSMVWFAHQWVGWAMYAPLGAFGALLPWLSMRDVAKQERPMQQGHYMACQVYGMGLVLAVLAAVFNAVGGQGSAIIFAMGGFLGLGGGHLLDQPGQLSVRTMMSVMALATLPIISLGAILGTFVSILMERMALTGHHSTILADSVIGGLVGSSVLGYSCTVLLPLIGYALTPLRKPLLALLLATSLGFAGYASYGIEHYSSEAPRRVLITHLHETGSWLPHAAAHTSRTVPAHTPPADYTLAVASGINSAAADAVAAGALDQAGDGQQAAAAADDANESHGSDAGVQASVAAAAAAELRQLQRQWSANSKMVLGVCDSNPFAQLLPHVAPSLRTQPVPSSGHEYGALYPLDKLVASLSFKSEAQLSAELLVPEPPHILLLATKQLPLLTPGSGEEDKDDVIIASSLAGQQHAVDNSHTLLQLDLQMMVQRRCWGMLNVTTTKQGVDLAAWSFAGTLAPSPTAWGGVQHMLRFSTQDPMPGWPFWLQLLLPSGATSSGELLGLRLELHVSYLPITAELARAMDSMPPWATPSWITTTFFSTWQF